MVKPKLIRCSKCAKTSIDFGVGFASVPSYFCTEHHKYVEKHDGCTFGEPGEPDGYICRNASVDNVDPIVYEHEY